MVSCPQFCRTVKQLPGLEQMGNLSLGYFMESAQAGDGPQQLEIHLISDEPPPTLPSWDELYPPLLSVFQMHARHFVGCWWKNCDPDPKPLFVWMQTMEHPPDGWWLKDCSEDVLAFHNNEAQPFWSPCREANSLISPPVFRRGILPCEISLVCGFVYADWSITCFLGWELFAQTKTVQMHVIYNEFSGKSASGSAVFQIIA